MNKELESTLSSPKLKRKESIPKISLGSPKLKRKESIPKISLGSPKLERALSSPKLEGKFELKGKLVRAAPKLKLDLKPKDEDSNDSKPRKLKNKFKPTIDLSAINIERRRSSENLENSEKYKVYQLFEKLKSLAPEDNLDDKYIKIEKKLASGMYGVVGFYYKKNSPIDKMYIVKAISYKKGFDVLYDNDSIKIEVYNKLINEILSLKKMQENNCKETNFVDLCFIEVFRDDENIYIVTQFKNDTISLQKYIEQNTLTLKQITTILFILLDKLKIIHSLSIVHNDIKPANILVQYNKNDIVDLSYIDYGESCLCNESNKCLTSGSVYYHPENVLYLTQQLCNLTYYNDIYSLGMTIKELSDKSKKQNDEFINIIKENMLNLDMYDKPYTIDFLNNLINTLKNILTN